MLHANPRFHFPPEFGATLTAEERVQTLFWDGSACAATETVFTDAEGLDRLPASRSSPSTGTLVRSTACRGGHGARGAVARGA